MALDATQLVTLAEIAQEELDTIIALSTSLTAEQNTLIAADIITWNLNRDDVDVEMSGGSKGISWRAQRLLDAIRSRVRKMLGLSSVSWEVCGYSQNVGHTWVW